MFRNLMRVCCYAPSPTQPGGSFLARPTRRKRFKNVRLPNNPEVLCFSQLQDQSHIRITGHAEGQQCYIEECKACKIVIFGDCASLMVVNCSDCFIHVASVDGSVMMRNCQSCRCCFCCRQFRWLYGYRVNLILQQLWTYDSADEVWMRGQEYLVYCSTISRLLCLAKTDELGSMKVSAWSTKGIDVHDFTPDSSTRHWTCLPERLQDEEGSVAGKGDNRWDSCFLCFMERDAPLAYAYVVAAVWKDICMVGMSRADYVNKSVLKGFVYSLGPLMNSDERTWLRALIAAKAIVIEVAGAECISTWQQTIQEVGNEKAHFFMTKHCRIPGQSLCSYYAGSPSSEDMGGSRCQMLLQKLLGFAKNDMDLNQVIETSASS